jgi:hypothetical protein
MFSVFEKEGKVVLELEGLESKTVFLHAQDIKPLEIRTILFGHPLFPPLKAFMRFMLDVIITFLHTNDTAIKKKLQEAFIVGYESLSEDKQVFKVFFIDKFVLMKVLAKLELFTKGAVLDGAFFEYEIELEPVKFRVVDVGEELVDECVKKDCLPFLIHF